MIYPITNNWFWGECVSDDLLSCESFRITLVVDGCSARRTKTRTNRGQTSHDEWDGTVARVDRVEIGWGDKRHGWGKDESSGGRGKNSPASVLCDPPTSAIRCIQIALIISPAEAIGTIIGFNTTGLRTISGDSLSKHGVILSCRLYLQGEGRREKKGEARIIDIDFA